ncbi:MAG TPA: LysR family transcriptional regulator, partial [Burkholderiaceae bacterium]|nr:LysR family transcriptional regulator [Burkholderiaceae bacterium]
LDFVPIQTERYFLLCDERSLETPDVQKTLAIVRSDAFRTAVDRLPGYQATDAGAVLELGQAFESLAPPAPPVGKRATRARRTAAA